MTDSLTPAALAEIRERDATCTRCGMPGDGAYPIIPVTGEHADWHICALALYHASIAKDATISRLTAELAAARKPQGIDEPLRMAREVTMGYLSLPRVWVVHVTFSSEDTAIAMGVAVEEIIKAESLGAQDGGEDQS